MIISEKQFIQLIQIAYQYLRVLDMNKDHLTECGIHNKMHVANILETIANQQSEELKKINDHNNN